MPGSTKTARRIDIEALKAERPLVDLVASYGVALRAEGTGRYRGLCPFHQERTPSFWIDARDSQSAHYYCFGCQAHGDVLTFVMEREDCSFVEACERLSTRARPTLHEQAPRQPKLPEVPTRRWEDLASDCEEANVLELALRVYEDELWRSPRALAYLCRRAIPEQLARKQRLGYASGRALLGTLRAQKDRAPELLALAVTLGLVMERPGTEEAAPRYREFFLDRLIVPELRDGHPIWCIGRAVEDTPQEGRPPVGLDSVSALTDSQPTRPRRPKYLGLPGEKPVLGLEHVVGRAAVYVCEGPVDWLAAINWGLPAFAICGTHFPADRLPVLAHAQAIYGVFDPDRAGMSAAERFAPLFGSRWRPVRLPNGMDLAELAELGEPGRELFKTLVGRARSAAWQQGRI
jgi:DNA primase